MSIGVRAITAAGRSHMESLGVFDRIGTHEPANAPGNGLAAWWWFDRLRPFSKASGLDATSVVLLFNTRITKNLQTEPADDVDAVMLDALDLLMEAYSGDFTLGGLVHSVDLLGRTELGALRCDAGYLDADEGTYRALMAYVPVLVLDVWTQGS